jgi:hypothetical protein
MKIPVMPRTNANPEPAAIDRQELLPLSRQAALRVTP